MYHLFGTDAILRDVVLLSAPHGDIDSRESMRSAYLRMLHSLGRHPGYRRLLADRISDANGARPHVTGVEPDISVLTEVFSDPVQADGVAVLPASPERMARCHRGLAHLRDRDPVLGELVSLLVHTLFSRSSSWTGSMSDRHAIGAMMVLPGDNWDDNDVAEGILHEFTHTALFLDERAHGHFRVGADGITLHSAIRHDERTMPAVVHSLLVAVEVLNWRARHGGDRAFKLHGPTDALVDKALESWESLKAVAEWDSVVKPRMRELVAAAGEALSSTLSDAVRTS